MSAAMPFEIDLIEVLYAMGEVKMCMARQMEPDETTRWRVINEMIIAKSASLWLCGVAGDRRLADWEVAAIFRTRLQNSCESDIPDEQLTIKSAENTFKAYHRDFGRWLDSCGDS